MVNKSNPSETDDLIDRLLQDWVMSNLEDYHKRYAAGQQLIKLSISPLYQRVPNNVLYRFGTLQQNPRLQSWTYDIKSAKKIGLLHSEDGRIGKIDVKPSNDLKILICIPTFYKVTNRFPNHSFMKLVGIEKEVLVDVLRLA